MTPRDDQDMQDVNGEHGQDQASRDRCPTTVRASDPSAVEPSEEVSVERMPGSRRARITPDGRFVSGRLKGLTMGGAILALAWPVMIESFLNSFVGLTDTALAAGIGEGATDAIGGGSYIMWFIGLVIMALGVGATALVSRSVGSGRTAVANAALGQTVLLAGLLGVVVGIVVAMLVAPVATLLNMGPVATQAFRDYMLVICAGVPFASILFALIACARGAGDSIRPLWAMVVRNIVNVIVSVGLSGIDWTRATEIDGELVRTVIWENPSPFAMGVTGIALGTVAGDIVGALIVLVMARSGIWGIRLRMARLKPHWHTMRRLVRLGLPNFFETLGMWLGNFAIVLMVGSIGASGLLGAHIVAIRIEAFSFLPGFAMGTAAATLAGQYLGAGSPALAKRAVLICAGVAAVVMGTIGLGFIFAGVWITSLLSTQPTHLAEVPRLLLICGLVQVPFAFGIVFRSAMRGAGDVKAVMAMTWVCTYVIRLPMVYVFSGVDIALPGWFTGGEAVIVPNPSPFEPSLAGLWLGMCLELIVRGTLFATRFARGKWLEKAV